MDTKELAQQIYITFLQTAMTTIKMKDEFYEKIAERAIQAANAFEKQWQKNSEEEENNA